MSCEYTYTAILVAAGKSTRMGGQSKIFAEIKGQTVIEKTLSVFSSSDVINKIVVVCRDEDLSKIKDIIKVCSKPVSLTVGGETRQASVLNGIKLADESDFLVIHDAARPLVSEEIIKTVCEDAVAHGASSAAVWAKDTCKLVDENGFVTETPKRENLMMVQTPQVFERKAYLAAVKKAEELNKDFTDDCQLIEFAGGKVHLVNADYKNIKITTPDDLITANAFCSGGEKMRIGYGYDVHKLTENRKLILGGVDVPFEKGLLGHSDADVLAHAISDSILGACAMGDIGRLFPDTDENFKGADSIELLKEVCVRVKQKGFNIGNIDATIRAQRPKLAPYIDKMRENIAIACGVDISVISVKATTEESLGFTGREEGMAASAVCLVY